MISIKGHPVHAMLVHFPSALFPIEFLSHALHLFFDDPRLGAFSFYAILMGAAFGWMAACLGLIDLLQLSDDPQHQPNLKLGMIHGSLHGFILCAYTVLALLQLTHTPATWLFNWPLLLAKLPLVAGLIVSNFFGAHILFNILKRQWMNRN